MATILKDGRVKIYARLSYPQLVKAMPLRGDPNSKPRYSAKLIIERDSEDHKAILKVLKQKFNTTFSTVPEDERNRQFEKLLKTEGRCFISDGEDDGFDGMLKLAAYTPGTSSRPLCVDQRRELIPVEDIERVLYSGCYVYAIIEPWIQNMDRFGKGLRCALSGIQFAKDGEHFSGVKISRVDEFDEIEAASDNAFDDLV
ncbi:MAG: DUF2815 family protein [Paraprevotella sp.]|nr:DUF2815 family protein [Paraprevotella sp.]